MLNRDSDELYRCLVITGGKKGCRQVRIVVFFISVQTHLLSSSTMINLVRKTNTYIEKNAFGNSLLNNHVGIKINYLWTNRCMLLVSFSFSIWNRTNEESTERTRKRKREREKEEDYDKLNDLFILFLWQRERNFWLMALLKGTRK